MTSFLVGYVVAWAAACLVAVGLMISLRRNMVLLKRSYWRVLLQPWKVVTFCVAAAGMILIAPYSGDYT